jgi:hypothetical protein
METTADGQERFKPGSKIGTDWSAHHAWQQDAARANKDYTSKLRELPRRPREDLAAGLGGRRHGLPGNYTVDEREYTFSSPQHSDIVILPFSIW